MPYDRFTHVFLPWVHIAHWRALLGPEKSVIFPQVHQPARMAQSDFTHMEELEITLAGQPFPHLLYHLVLTYSNIEAVSICLSETFEALAEGLEAALWQIGGVPQLHRTDHLSAAIRRLDKAGREDFTDCRVIASSTPSTLKRCRPLGARMTTRTKHHKKPR